jgi:serine/threonine-protein kinase
MDIRHKRIIQFLTVLVFFLVFGYFVFNWIMAAALHSRKEVIIPDVTKKTLYEATKLLSACNLGLKLEGEEFNQDLPAGAIVRQTPYAGMTTKEGKIVRVTVSQGGEFVYVPNLIAQSARTAGISLRSAGLNLGEETSKFSLSVAKGNVLSQDPKPGTVSEKDSLVSLVVSAGLPPNNIKLMPDFKNKNIDDVKEWAKDNGINVTFKQENSENLVTGAVMHQTPDPDTNLADNNAVEIVTAVSVGNASGSGKKFVYDVPPSSSEQKIKLSLIDSVGEKEIFNGTKPGGSKLEVMINPQGNARMRVFLNNVLIEERDVQ